MTPRQKKEFYKLIRELANEAVSVGRTNWDSYYGHNNDYHLVDMEEWPAFHALVTWAAKELKPCTRSKS